MGREDMKVVAIHDFMNCLTKGKEYEVVEYRKSKPDWNDRMGYVVITNHRDHRFFYETRFVRVAE
jgi:hypothetical protein